jgi:hypothetical protein
VNRCELWPTYHRLLRLVGLTNFLDTFVEGIRVKADRSQHLKKAPEDSLKTAEKAATRLNRMKDALEQTSKRIDQIPFATEVTLPSGIVPKVTIGRRQT